MKQLSLILLILISVSADAQRPVKTDKLLQDFDFLVTELKQRHQGLYQYEAKPLVDSKIEALRAEIKTPMTKFAFYGLVNRLITLTNEGHTSADLRGRTKLALGLSKTFLPIAVKHCEEGYIITQNFGTDTTALQKGDRLLAINGLPMDSVLVRLFPYMTTDGFNETSKYEWVGGVGLIQLYRLVFGGHATFKLTIQHYQDEEALDVNMPAIRYTDLKNKNSKFGLIPFSYTRFNYKQLSDSVACLTVPGFGKDGLDYEAFYKNAFRQLDSAGIRHLIIDIQANGGGTEGNENLLFSYLTDRSIQKYSKVTMLRKAYVRNRNSKNFIFDKWKLAGEYAERGAFTLQSDYLSDLGYARPDPSLIFSGKVYVLISGRTFSGGAEFSSLVKMSNRGVFIGEETGGTYEGNVSGYSEAIKLRYSDINVNIPKVHFQINVKPAIRGRGVMPDYQQGQSWDDYMKGENSRLKYVIRLIEEKKYHP